MGTNDVLVGAYDEHVLYRESELDEMWITFNDNNFDTIPDDSVESAPAAEPEPTTTPAPPPPPAPAPPPPPPPPPAPTPPPPPPPKWMRISSHRV